jgi:hypothetical protein
MSVRASHITTGGTRPPWPGLPSQCERICFWRFLCPLARTAAKGYQAGLLARVTAPSSRRP